MLITARPLTAWHGRSTYNNAYHSNVAQNIVMFERTASIEVNVESCQWTSKPGKCQIWLVASSVVIRRSRGRGQQSGHL